MYLRFLMKLEIRFVSVRLNYVQKLRYKIVTFYLRLFLTKK